MDIQKWISLIFLSLCCISLSFAQDPIISETLETPFVEQCGFDQIQQLEKEKNSKYYQLQQQLEEEVFKVFKNKLKEGGGVAKSTYTIPVVVHVVHNNGPENISDEQIEAGIEHMNAAFANTGYYDQGSGVDVDIEFCLARQDPQGNLTSGITRNVSTLTNVVIPDEDLQLKNINRWDPESYINIWVVNSIEDPNIDFSIGGYAYFPSSHGAANDGVVIVSTAIGYSSSGTAILVHEMGHYLGLYHTFQGGCVNNDCLIDGDRVCDTPPDQSTSAVWCSQDVNTCSTDTNSGFSSDQFDQTWNYMDYQFQVCQHDFTNGQKDRMLFFLNTARQSLLNSRGCMDPCPVVMEIDIGTNPTNIAVGDDFSITAITNNVDQVNWYLDGEWISEGQTFSYHFLELGSYELKAKGTNSWASCFIEAIITLLDFGRSKNKF